MRNCDVNWNVRSGQNGSQAFTFERLPPPEASSLSGDASAISKIIEQAQERDQSLGRPLASLRKQTAVARNPMNNGAGGNVSHRMPLVQALSKTVAMGYGTVISCIPGKLGYYEGEDPRERYLLVVP